eukprot:g1597.t1
MSEEKQGKAIERPFLKQRRYELSRELSAVNECLCFNAKRPNNLVFLEREKRILLTIAGNAVHILSPEEGSLETGKVPRMNRKFLFGVEGAGVGAVAVHPNEKYFAIGERGTSPRVFIFEYPSFKLTKVLTNGTESAFSAMTFSHDGSQLATVGSKFDYMLTIWDWEKESVIRRAKAFSQEIYSVKFSKYFDGKLQTSGTTHLRLWTMAQTFTGLKLQGNIGKFGKIDLSDVLAFTEIKSNGDIISGTESGVILLWEDQFVRCMIGRPDGEIAHDGEVTHLDIVEDTLISAGRDGFIRWWDMVSILNFEPSDKQPHLELQPMKEVKIDGEIVHILKTSSIWFVQDARGKLLYVDPDGKEGQNSKSIMESHSGPINAVDASPCDYYAASVGSDCTVRCWNMITNECTFLRTFDQPATSLLWLPKSVDPEGKTIVVGFANGVVRFLKRFATSWHLKDVVRPHTERVNSIALSNSGKLMSTVSDDGKVWFLRIDASHTEEDHMWQPVGFVDFREPVKCVDWFGDEKVIVACGERSIEITYEDVAPSVTANSFDLSVSLHMEEHLWRPKPTMKQTEADDEDDDEEEINQPNVNFVKYKRNNIDELYYLSLDGEHNGFVYEQKVSSEYSANEIRSHPSGTTIIQHSPSGKFLLTGGEDGSVYVRQAASPKYYVNITAHLGNKITSLCCSFDDTIVFSADEHGVLYSHRIRPLQIELHASDAADKNKPFPKGELDVKSVKECENISPFTSLYPIAEKEGATDKEMYAIEAEDVFAANPDAYSLEDDKLKREEDMKKHDADLKKEQIRENIQTLTEKILAIRKENENAQDGLRLSEEEFNIDVELNAMFLRKAEKGVEELRNSMAYDAEVIRRKCEKLKAKFIENIRVPSITLSALILDLKVDSFQTVSLPETVEKGIEMVQDNLTLQQESAKDNERSKRSGRQAEEAAAAAARGDFVTAMQIRKKIDPLKNEVTKDVDSEGKETKGDADDGEKTREFSTIAQREELRKKLRQIRKEKKLMLEKRQPKKTDVDPFDIAMIEYAKNNLGDYKLKSGQNYIVPPNKQMTSQKKRQQLLLLEYNIFEHKMNYNADFLKLRQNKKELIDEIQLSISRYDEIIGRLNLPDTLDAKYRAINHDLSEFPENCTEVALDEINDYLIANGNKDSVVRVEEGIAESGAAIVYPKLFLIDVKTDGVKSNLELAHSQAEKIELEYEAKSIVKNIERKVAKFDEILEEHRIEKKQLDADLTKADINLLIMRHEYFLLKQFDDQDKALHTKLEKCRMDRAQIIADISTSQEKLKKEKADIRSWQEKEKSIMNEFHSLVGEKNPFYEILLKTFKRKIKRNKKKNDDEELSDSEDEDAYDDSEDDSDYDSDDDLSVTEENCPPGCDQQLYDKVLELREKRLDQEEILNECQKTIENLKKMNDRHIAKEKQTQKELLQTEMEIQKFQSEKQKCLNDLYSYIVVHVNQIQNNIGGKEGEKGASTSSVDATNLALPPNLSDSVMCSRALTEKLNKRIGELHDEKKLLAKHYDHLKRERNSMKVSEKQMSRKIDVLEKECLALQRLKFGREIDLDNLDKMSISQAIKDRQQQTRIKELKFDRNRMEREKNLDQTKQSLLKCTQENTKLLRAIAELTQEKQNMEDQLDSSAKEVSKAGKGPQMQMEYRERNRLIQLVKVQAKEVDALKAEINMLRRKTGHLYTPNQ